MLSSQGPVTQDAVRFLHPLKCLIGRGVGGAAVGVQAQYQSAVGPLDFLLLSLQGVWGPAVSTPASSQRKTAHVTGNRQP